MINRLLYIFCTGFNFFENVSDNGGHIYEPNFPKFGENSIFVNNFCSKCVVIINLVQNM